MLVAISTRVAAQHFSNVNVNEIAASTTQVFTFGGLWLVSLDQ